MVCIGCLGHSGDVRFVHFRQNKCDVGVDNTFNFPQKKSLTKIWQFEKTSILL
jgi:hypothetical protein